MLTTLKRVQNTCFAVDDYLVLKYLLARGWDVKKASKLMQEQLDFRNKYRPEESLFNWALSTQVASSWDLVVGVNR